MKTTILFLLFFSSVAVAQEVENKTSVQLFIGTSLHGTGDARGLEYGGTYTSDLGKRAYWFAEAGGSIHAGEWPIFYYSNFSGELIDASIHYTTAGVQAVGGVGLKLLKKSRHEISLRVGALVRYQSSSYWDQVGVYYPSTGDGIDFPVVTFRNTTPRKTMSLGGRGSFSYSFSFTSKLFLALNASLQTDSNGDTLTSATLGIGRKL